ncbi:tripartite motif-containing protein 2-like [Branchiostoma lanceolatum]|uniref:tripartite motif-containing protein 2-like n=1 Tax=Branchiostoma lanceolatum TaxID=7740 RepID=UPI003454C913
MEDNRRISLGPEFLRCGICLDAFTNPKALSCLHTFCRDCLAQYAARRTSFPCPNCRRTVFLPSASGIDGLPDNFWLSNIKEELSKKKKKGAPSGEEKCAVHAEEKKRWFCENCKHPICDECIVESHNGHRVTKFKELLAAKREEMHSLRQAVTEQVDSMKTQLEKTEEEGRKIMATKGKVEAEIRDCAQAWCDIIRQKERQLLDKTAKVTEETQSLFLEERERMRIAIIDVSTMLDKVKATTDEGNLDEVLRGVEVLTTLRQNADDIKQASTTIETPKISFTPLEVWPTELGEVKVPSIPDKRVKGRTKSYRDSGQLRMGGQHLLFPKTPSNRVASTSRVVRVGGPECGQGALEEPSGLAVTSDKKILVSDWAKQVIQVFDQNGRFVRNVNLNDRGKVSPGRLAIDSRSGRIYLQCTVPCNTGRDKKIVKVLSDKGRHLFQLGSGLRRPHGVSCHTATGNIAILDTELRMVVIMSRDGERQMSTFGCNLEHNAPPPICLDSIAVAPNGDIVMADWWYSCVKVFDPEGHVRFTFGSPGERGGQLNHPGGVCVDSRGNIIVADERNGRVQMFDASGNFARVLASRSDGLEFPNCVAAVDDGKIAVTDDGKKCVFLIEHDRA